MGTARSRFIFSSHPRTSRPTVARSATAWRICASWSTRFTSRSFSFKEVIKAHPEAGGWITDCLSGDVNKDYTQLWAWIREFVPLPDDLPYGEPLLVETAAA